MQVEIDGASILVTEMEDPDKSQACFCTCPYELSIEIENLAAGGDPGRPRHDARRLNGGTRT